MESPIYTLVCLHQITSKVGGLAYNLDAIGSAYLSHKASLHVFPDCALSGFPLRSLASSKGFVRAHSHYLKQVVGLTAERQGAILLGALSSTENEDGHIADALFINKGTIKIVASRCLSSHKASSGLIQVKNTDYGIVYGQADEAFLHETSTRYGTANLIIINNAAYGPKFISNIEDMEHCAKKHQINLHYINQLGVRDELFYPGFSSIFNGSASAQQIAFEEGSLTENCNEHPLAGYSKDEMDYAVAMLALRHYYYQNNFTGITLGVSGGIDSALSLIIAVDAIGADKVQAVIMPSRYNDQSGMEAAIAYCSSLEVKSTLMPIDSLQQSFVEALSVEISCASDNKTSENLQSRIRGVILMAFSNSHNSLLLNCGNKTESLMGYCTLYGDTCGCYSSISDLYKADVYRLAKWRNNNIPTHALGRHQKPIPELFINRAPSAELRPNQTDEEDLPLQSYRKIDDVLMLLIEEGRSLDEIKGKLGYDSDQIDALYMRLISSEHKRRQLCTGVRITSNDKFPSFPLGTSIEKT